MSDDQLPTFVVIGAMKAGTTTLYEHLRAHPSVFMSPVKEPEFFSEDSHWARGVDWYRSLFRDGTEHLARGEASTGYTRLPRYEAAAERMAQVIPRARLLYLVRDPVERMCSHHRHSVLAGREHRRLSEALLAGDGYLATSQYARQLGRYREHFTEDQILVVFTDDLERAPAATLQRVDEFIGVDPQRRPSPSDRSHHVSADRVQLPRAVRSLDRLIPTAGVSRRFPRTAARLRSALGRRPAALDDQLDPATRQALLEVLRPDLEELETMVGPLPDRWRAVG